MIRRARHASPWFKPTTSVRKSRLLAVLPAVAPAPPPPSVDLIMGLVRIYGAQCLAYGKSPTDAAHMLTAIDEQEELIRHNVSLLDGWLVGTSFLLSDLQKTLDPPEEQP